MTKELSERVLAIDAHPSSFGFAVLERPHRFVDWGARSFRRGVNAVKIPMRDKLAFLIAEYEPAFILVMRPRVNRSLRLATISRVARAHNVRVRIVSRKSINGAFPDTRNKHELALAVANRMPTLSSYVPPRRKLWQHEHYRMTMFIAAAIALIYFDRTPSAG